MCRIADRRRFAGGCADRRRLERWRRVRRWRLWGRMRAEGVGDGAGELEGGDDVSLDGGDSREVVEKVVAV